MTAGIQLRRVPVYVVLSPRTLLLDVAGPVEVLRMGNREQDSVRFEVRYVGPAESILTSIGLCVSCVEPLPEALPDAAMIVIPGSVEHVIGGAGEPPTRHQIEDAGMEACAQSSAVVQWLRNTVCPGHTLISICSGALLAAQAGLLDGYNCTTHHSCCKQLAAIAPRARVLENRLFVEDGDRYTSAGVTAGIDLMLHMVAQQTSPACAAAIARQLVVYLRRSGCDPQLSPWLEGRNHLHPAVHRVQDAVAAAPADDWPLMKLSRIAGASTRHLSRLFHENTGMSITDYRNRLRVTLAHELLSNTQLDMGHVAERSGFASTRQLRRAWRKSYSTAPKQARQASAQ